MILVGRMFVDFVLCPAVVISSDTAGVRAVDNLTLITYKLLCNWGGGGESEALI